MLGTIPDVMVILPYPISSVSLSSLGKEQRGPYALPGVLCEEHMCPYALAGVVEDRG